MMNLTFDKTDKGREEIATRKFRLAPRLRSLLVLVDGKHTGEELIKKVSGLGLNEESINELLNNEFIHSVKAAEPLAPPPLIVAQPKPPKEDIPTATETQFQTIYNFYTETIKSTLGIRGYGLQMKVERANTIEDFRQLQDAYLEAVQKANGKEMARSLNDRLQQLLNGKDG